jgi:oligopeptidase A
METQLPQFNNLDLTQFSNQLDTLLATNLQKINSLITHSIPPTWDNLMEKLEDMDNQLEIFWSPLSHLHAVMNSPKLRECYQACLPKLSAYETAIGHNQALYDAIKSIDIQTLTTTQQKIINDHVRDFELSGVALSPEKKHRFEEIEARLSDLSNQFENHVLDATQAYALHITDESRLKGLPEHALHAAKNLAIEKKLPGFIISLEIPSYLAVMTYADCRNLREEIYQAYVTRASDQGPFAEKFDNSPIMNELLALRHEKACLLGFANFAELSIATKMVESTTQVIDFLNSLIKKSHSQAEHELNELALFSKQEFSLEKLAPWDIAYLSEKKRQARFAISQEELRAYFPLSTVMSGLFFIVGKLYGMHLKEIKGIDIWHPEVQCYQILDTHDAIRGYIYMDLFARQNKRGGAWMDSFQSRRKNSDGSIQPPIASLNCNFAKPAANKPPTLSHDELLTFFHEFGHCLHHVLTQVDYLSASGINGVEWDAVELPSQFFENWCWEEKALEQLAEHVDTHEPLPHALFEKLIAVKNFQSAMGMMRQLEFSLFDFRIHQETALNSPTFIHDILNDVRKKTTVVPIVPCNRTQHSFSHIFAGGYAAGYYSYKWAEVLSSDAFSRFEEEGVFNPQTGQDFLHEILEVGGSRKAQEAFERFRGRKATVDALLRQNGILKKDTD